MPWKGSSVLEQRKAFLAASESGAESLAELCRQYGISRQTGYKWLKRFGEEGDAGLQERSRAPRQQSQQMLEEVAEEILQLRRGHLRWGPRKLKAYLERKAPQIEWPAASSIGALLKREGLVVERRKRIRIPSYRDPLQHADQPNRVWCADFTGWFLCGDGKRCDPLTCTDAFSRYLLRTRAVPKTDGPHVKSVFEAMFREYGLPEAIRSDNSPPFGSKAPGGLSRLSMWWLQLGIRHERIQPGCPQQNGRHERMHETLKQETASPPRATLQQQQLASLPLRRSSTTSVRMKHWTTGRRRSCMSDRRDRTHRSCRNWSIRADRCCGGSRSKEVSKGNANGRSSARSWHARWWGCWKRKIPSSRCTTGRC